MRRIISLSVVLMGIIYFLPFMTGEKELEEISIPTISEFSIKDIVDFSDTEEISVLIDDEVVKMDIDDYIIGVVSAEMPASFEQEALKAQAVASRTYIHYKKNLIDSGRSDGVHDDALVCDKFTHCKAYIDIENNNPWGDDYDKYKTKIEKAVRATKDEVIVYNEQPIAAVFHAASSGNTESSKDVWGGDFPYLVSVESVGSKDSPKYEAETKIEFSEFEDKITSKNSQVILPKDTKDWFKASTRSESGGIIEVYIGGCEFSGNEIREMFKLNSTNFTVSYDKENVIFKTKGYGHGVGMSQYGANGLAKEGENYKDILTWYYSGTEIVEKVIK